MLMYIYIWIYIVAILGYVSTQVFVHTLATAPPTFVHIFVYMYIYERRKLENQSAGFT